MLQTVEPRLPMAVTISAGLFAIGVGYASTAPYVAIIAIEEAIRAGERR
jgi:MFS transporter, SET family, sugar efflux transporter